MCQPNVAEQNLELWSNWVQSPYVRVICPDGEICLPRELLSHRSPYFRRAIEQQERGDGHKGIRLEDVELTTLKIFQRWCMSDKPSIPDETTCPALLDLGIFATSCQVFALEHRVVDRFLEKFNDVSGGDKWTLRADMVAHILRQCDPSSCLRRLIWHKLSSLPPQQLLDEWSEWSELAATDGAEVLLDLLKTMTTRAVGFSNVRGRNGSHYPTHSLFNDPCRFHDHSRQHFESLHTEQRLGRHFQPECPFRRMECFSDNAVVYNHLPAVDDEEAATSSDQTGAVEAPKETAVLGDEPASFEAPHDEKDPPTEGSPDAGEDVVIVTSPELDNDDGFKSRKQLMKERKDAKKKQSRSAWFSEV